VPAMDLETSLPTTTTTTTFVDSQDVDFWSSFELDGDGGGENSNQLDLPEVRARKDYSGHSANSVSANTPGRPPASSYRTPQRPTTPSGSNNSGSSGSGTGSGTGSGRSGRSTRPSPLHPVTPSKRSGKTPSSEEGPKPLRMMCWHRASGVACSGGRSDEARRLLEYVPLLFFRGGKSKVPSW
jgi:hypothetical protein